MAKYVIQIQTAECKVTGYRSIDQSDGDKGGRERQRLITKYRQIFMEQRGLTDEETYLTRKDRHENVV
jgi:hypothetical protein